MVVCLFWQTLLTCGDLVCLFVSFVVRGCGGLGVLVVVCLLFGWLRWIIVLLTCR